MNKKLPPIEQLDEVLKLLANEKYSELKGKLPFEYSQYTEEDILNKMNYPTDRINSTEFKNVLLKLHKDGYINIEREDIKMKGFEEESLNKSFIEMSYIISFEGNIFISNGGYKKERKQKNISTNLQSLQTWAIVIGTLGIFLWEVLKYFHHHYHIF